MVSGLLKDPQQLRADLDRMIELKRDSVRGNPEREAKVWLDKLAEVERKRSGYIDLAAEGIMDRNELRAKLAALEETRKTAERELEALRNHEEHIAELEAERDALLGSLMDTAPDALDSLAPEERQHVYKMLRLKVVIYQEDVMEVSGAFGEGFLMCNLEKESGSTSSPTTGTRRG